MLANDPARARSQRMELAIQRPEKLVAALESAVQQGKAGGEGRMAALARIAAMAARSGEVRRARRRVRGDVRSIAALVGAPPRAGSEKGGPAGAVEAIAAERPRRPPPDKETLVWDGVLAGATPPQLARLADFASRSSVAQIDMTDVERVDFIFAGALFNAISRIEGQGKAGRSAARRRSFERS